MKSAPCTVLLLIVSSLGCSSAVWAAEPQTPTGAAASAPAESRWQLGLALGYGMRTNPLLQSDDIPVVVDVDIAWFGDRFFFDNGDLGLTLVNGESITANIVGRANSDRVFFSKTDTKFVALGVSGAPLAEPAVLTIPDRDYAGELGVEILADGLWGQLQAGAFHDVSNTHDGYEFYVDYGYDWRNQRWYLEPSIGISYKSANLNNYYWGIRADESNEVLPVYEPDSGINGHVRLHLGYQLSKHWAFSLVGEFERLNDGAAASPIVKDRNVVAYFAGFGYRFL